MGPGWDRPTVEVGPAGASIPVIPVPDNGPMTGAATGSGVGSVGGSSSQRDAVPASTDSAGGSGRISISTAFAAIDTVGSTDPGAGALAGAPPPLCFSRTARRAVSLSKASIWRVSSMLRATA